MEGRKEKKRKRKKRKRTNALPRFPSFPCPTNFASGPPLSPLISFHSSSLSIHRLRMALKENDPFEVNFTTRLLLLPPLKALRITAKNDIRYHIDNYRARNFPSKLYIATRDKRFDFVSENLIVLNKVHETAYRLNEASEPRHEQLLLALHVSVARCLDFTREIQART